MKEQHDNINSIISTMKDANILNTKKVSDKYHTFGELYIQRIYLFSIICNQNKEIAWKSRKHFDEENDPMFNGDFIVGLDTPMGPASYHCKIEFWDLFEVQEIDYAPKFDGYTPMEALERLRSILDHQKEKIITRK